MVFSKAFENFVRQLKSKAYRARINHKMRTPFSKGLIVRGILATQNLFTVLVFLPSPLHIVDAIGSTVESAKTSAQAAVDTGKTYVESAKGMLLKDSPI